MKKYITVILVCAVFSLIAIPGVFSAWNQELKIEGKFTIKAPNGQDEADKGPAKREAVTAPSENMPAAPGTGDESAVGGSTENPIESGDTEGDTVEPGETGTTTDDNKTEEPKSDIDKPDSEDKTESTGGSTEGSGEGSEPSSGGSDSGGQSDE
jgi:hypothetical protein